MSAGDPLIYKTAMDAYQQSLQNSMYTYINTQTMNAFYPTTTTTTTASTHINTNTVFNGGLSISGQNAASGVLSVGGTGGLQWNGNPIQTSWNTPKINNISDMLKDSMSREIIMCTDREECQRKYGEYGLKLFDSMLSEVLGEAIKAEELFNLKIQSQIDKTTEIKRLVDEYIPEEVKKQIAYLELGILA